MYNAHVGFSYLNWIYPIRRLSRCKEPSRVILLLDGKTKSRNDYTFDFDPSDKHNWLPFRHNNANNYLYVDGHADRQQLNLATYDLDFWHYYWLCGDVWPE